MLGAALQAAGSAAEMSQMPWEQQQARTLCFVAYLSPAVQISRLAESCVCSSAWVRMRWLIILEQGQGSGSNLYTHLRRHGGQASDLLLLPGKQL